MKCVNCGTDNNLQERTANGGRCKNCHHHFAFDPQAGSKFTDVFFKRSLEAISSENTLFFTRKQFSYALGKRLKANSARGLVEHLFVFFSSIVVLPFFLLFIPRMIGGILNSILGLVNIQISVSESVYWICVLVLAAITFLLLFLANISDITSENVSSKDRKNSALTVQMLGFLSIIGSVVSAQNYDGPNEIKFFIFLIGLGVGLFLIYFAWRQINRSYYIPQRLDLPAPEEVNNWLERWTNINGSVKKLLLSPKEESINIEVSSDINAYSFDRLLVCETAELAQFLIANNFHFEHNCAVLSITGYPQSIFNTVMEMLRRNSDLKVYAFHNASPRGVGLINHLRTSNNWFANSDAIIYDLGLFPRHIFSSKNMWILNSSESAASAKEMPAAVRQGLSVDEIAWLEMGNYVELESFSPQRLLRVASRGVANSQSFSGGESLDGDDGGSLADSGDAYIFVFDSFG